MKFLRSAAVSLVIGLTTSAHLVGREAADGASLKQVASISSDADYVYTPPSNRISPLVQSGLRVLFERELATYEFDDSSHDVSGNYEEVSSFLWLLGYLETESIFPSTEPTWYWPRNLGRNSDIDVPRSGSIQLMLKYDGGGTLTDVKMNACSVGGSKSSLDSDDRYGPTCKTLLTILERWFANWKMVPADGPYISIPRVIEKNWNFRRKLVDKGFWSHFADDDQVYTNFPKTQIRLVNEFLEKEDWGGLVTLARDNREKHVLHQYYAGLGLLKQGQVEESILLWSEYLENAQYLYPQFSAYAAITVISHYYELGDDERVMAIGQHFDLKQFKTDFQGSTLSRSATIAQIQYLSSITLIDEPRIATALKGLLELKEDELVQSDPKVESLVDEQLEGLLQQIANINPPDIT